MSRKIIVKDICLCCGVELIEDENIKKNYHKPICNKCREVILNYFMNKDLIERIMKVRAIREREKESE